MTTEEEAAPAGGGEGPGKAGGGGDDRTLPEQPLRRESDKSSAPEADPADSPKDKDSDDENGAPCGGGKSPASSLLAFLRSPRLESTGRSTLMAFLGYVISVSYLPQAIPPSMTGLIGILAATLGLSAPKLAFAVGAVGPVLVVVMIIAMAVGSMYLAAAAVSDGLMSAMFSVCVFWFTGLRHGPDEGSTAGWMGLVICISGMMSLSLWQLVRDGISATVTGDGHISDQLQAMLGKLCLTLERPEDCWVEKLPDFSKTVAVEIPSGNFAGQYAYLTYEGDDSITVDVPGGLWIVAGLWSWKGLTNPLAFFRNFMIALCWAMLCIGVGVFVPPVRTARRAFAGALVPMAIKDAAAAMRAYARAGVDDGGDDGGKEEGPPADEDEDEDAAEEEAARETRMIGTANALYDGGSAALIAYEPRLCGNPFELAWPKLKELMVAANVLTVTALAAYDDHHVERGLAVRQGGGRLGLSASERGAPERLDRCAAALATDGDAEELERGVEAGEEGAAAEGAEEGEARRSVFARSALQKTRRVEAATVEWLRSLHHPQMAGCKGCLMSYAPFAVPFLLVLKRLVVTLTLPFRPGRWHWPTVLNDVKFSAGLIALFLMEVYWDAYRNFTLSDGTAGNKMASSITINSNPSPNNFSGWALIGYIFSNTPTTEGSIKKGLLRAIGTCLGGFSAWLGVILCSGSYDESAPINPYGFVAWLTATHAIGNYFAVDNGPSALMGMSADHGHGGMYFCMTQAICATGIYGGGSRNNTVVNRIVANLVGILMASILAVVPPQVRGGNPAILRDLLEVQKEAFADGLRWLLLAGEPSDADEDRTAKLAKDAESIRDGFESAFRAKRKHAEFLVKDASRLRVLPYFRVDPRMMEQVRAQSVTGAYVYRALDHARLLFGGGGAEEGEADGNGKAHILRDARLRSQLQAALTRLEGGGGSGADAKGDDDVLAEYESARDAHEAEEIAIHYAIIISILKRFEDHEAVLADIK